MKIGEVIDSVLINDAAVSAIVGTSVFPLFAKQGAAYPLSLIHISEPTRPY